jgi:predicted alpha/beta hydrolase family esterase
MTRRVLFIQGGAAGAYEADEKLAASLLRELGDGWEVRYPRMPNEDDPDYGAWTRVIAEEVATMGEGAVLVGHSIGASVIVKWLTGGRVPKSIAGALLIAAPFWHDDAFWRWDEVRLPDDADAKLPPGLPVYLYHGGDDKVVPTAHLDMYAALIPSAIVRRLAGRDHQLNDDMSEVAEEIRRLS